MKKMLKKVMGTFVAAAICASMVPVFAYDKGDAYLSDTFADDGQITWKTAPTAAGITTSAEEVGGVLHYTSETVGDGIFKEPGVIFELNGGNGIEYKEGKKIAVKFKIRKEDTSFLHVKLDLPDSERWGNAQGYRGLLDIMKIENGEIYAKNGNGSGTSSYTKLVSGVNNKDVDVLIYLDGKNKKSDIIVSVDKQNYCAKDCDWSNPSTGSPGAEINDTALKSIAFVSDNVNGGTMESASVYIEDIDVREISDGTFADNFDNGTTENWIKAVGGTKVNAAFEGYDVQDGTLHYKATAIEDNGSDLPGVVRAINGLEGISYQTGEKLVLKFRVKKAPGASIYVKAGYPVSSGLAEEGNGWRGRKAIMKINDDSIGLKVDTKDGYNASAGLATKIENQVMTDKWIDTVVVLDGKKSTADYFITIDGKTYQFAALPWSTPGFTAGNAALEALTTLSFVSVAYPVKNENNETVYKTNAEVWIDNVSVSKTDGTFADDFSSGVKYDGWVTTKTSTAVTNIEMENGTIHYTSQNTTTKGLGDSAGIVRMINGSDGLPYEENSRYELKFKLKKESEGADVRLKADYNAFKGAGEMSEQGFRGELDIMLVTDSGIRVKDGNGFYEEWGETEDTTSYSRYRKVYTGSTVGKEIDVTIILDGLNRKANFKFVIDGQTYTANNCDWSDAKSAWTKHTENLTSLAFMSKAEGDATFADVSIGAMSLKKVAATEPSLVLTKNYTPIEGTTAIERGDKISAYYTFQGGTEGYGDYWLIIAGYKYDENNIKQIDEFKIVPLYADKLEPIEGLGEEYITVPAEGKYEVKAFLWDAKLQQPVLDAQSAMIAE